VTIALGAIFLAGTAREWYGLIVGHGLTISTNLFGTTFYSLVGLHASHVTIGLVILTLLCVFAFSGALRGAHLERAEIASWYWHFVDGVWIVVFPSSRSDDDESAGEDKPIKGRPGVIKLPAPTVWPLVLAFGVTLGFAGP
jgi:hypothetical protein